MAKRRRRRQPKVEPVVGSASTAPGNESRIAAIIPSKAINGQSRVSQPRVFCSVCFIEIDIKVQISNDPINKLPAGFSGSDAAQVSLDAMCTLGHGHEKSVDNENFVDKNTQCSLCPDCFGIVDDARELKQHIELLKADLLSRVVILRSKIEESSAIHQQELGRKKKPKKIVKELIKIQAVLKRALMDEPFVFSTKFELSEATKNFKTEDENNTNRRKRKRTAKMEYQEEDEEEDGVMLIESVQPMPAPSRHNGSFFKSETDFEIVQTLSSTNLPPIREKRKYTRRAAKTPKVEPEEDEDWSPVKQKRKYVRTKPLKRERELLNQSYEIIEDDGDNDIEFIIPVIKSVKTEYVRGSGVGNLLDAGDGTWLTAHIEPDEKGVILRSTLYANYYDHCLSNNRTPPNQATFGKLVKHTFHGIVSTRRLGKRGCSSYCHSGLRFKPDSPLNEITEEYDLVNDTDTHSKNKKKRGKPSLLDQIGLRIPQRMPSFNPRATHCPLLPMNQDLMTGRFQQLPPLNINQQPIIVPSLNTFNLPSQSLMEVLDQPSHIDELENLLLN